MSGPPTTEGYSERLKRASADAALATHPDFETLIGVLALAERAAETIVQIAAAGIERAQKADETLVTNADFASDALIIGGLREMFPDDGILSEESGSHHQDPPRRVWVVDPIDGTRAYAKQIPGYCVMIGLLEDEIPHLGIVVDPVESFAYLAVRGGGAYVLFPDERGLVRADLSGSPPNPPFPLVTTPSCPEATRQRLLASANLGAGPIINSVGIKVGLLLRGLAAVYFSHHGLSFWDTVAPLAIAYQAGARASLLDGTPLVYDLRVESTRRSHDAPLIVTPASIHDEVLDAVRAALGC